MNRANSDNADISSKLSTLRISSTAGLCVGTPDQVQTAQADSERNIACRDVSGLFSFAKSSICYLPRFSVPRKLLKRASPAPLYSKPGSGSEPRIGRHLKDDTQEW